MPKRPDPLRVMPKTIEAECYNRARLALLRLPPPVRLVLPDMRALEVILSHEDWLCVETLQIERPVLAWTDFETRGRSALHEPVRCRLHLYHHHAGLIMGEALEALDQALRARLSSLRLPLKESSP